MQRSALWEVLNKFALL